MTSSRPILNLALLMQGQFVTNLGNQVFDIAMLLWIKELTGSAAIMGLAMLLTGLPEALLAPFGGRIADRFGRLRVIILSDLVSAAVVGCVLIVVLVDVEPALAITASPMTKNKIGLLPSPTGGISSRPPASGEATRPVAEEDSCPEMRVARAP